MIKVFFECNNEELGESELDVLPQYLDTVRLERLEVYVKYAVMARVWVFSKNELPYVKIKLAKYND